MRSGDERERKNTDAAAGFIACCALEGVSVIYVSSLFLSSSAYPHAERILWWQRKEREASPSRVQRSNEAARGADVLRIRFGLLRSAQVRVFIRGRLSLSGLMFVSSKFDAGAPSPQRHSLTCASW